MRRYAQQALWFTLVLFFLITLAWSGTAVAETSSDIGSNTLQSLCTYNVSGANVGKVPAQFTSSDNLVNNTKFNNVNHIATEDWLAIQFPKSNVSDCTHDDPAGNNIAYATPATPGANSSHTIVPEINESISGLNQVSIKYEVQPLLKHGLYRSNITLFGVDENRDGFIEKSLNDSIEYVSVPRSNTIQISLDGNTTIPSDSYLVIRYDGVLNPEYVDTRNINTTIVGNKTVADGGDLEYSTNLSGLIGHGAELSITRANSELVTLRSSEMAVTNDSAYVFLPTQPQITKSRSYSLTLGSSHGYNSPSSAFTENTTINYTAFRRFAYVFSNRKIKNETMTVQGYTNIAPGSEVTIQVFNRGRLREVVATVNESQSLSANVTLPHELRNSEMLFINILDHDRTQLGQGVFTRKRLFPNQSRPST